jgi:hypothetical protein
MQSLPHGLKFEEHSDTPAIATTKAKRTRKRWASIAVVWGMKSKGTQVMEAIPGIPEAF